MIFTRIDREYYMNNRGVMVAAAVLLLAGIPGTPAAQQSAPTLPRI
jgi:hypothetical protein